MASTRANLTKNVNTLRLYTKKTPKGPPVLALLKKIANFVPAKVAFKAVKCPWWPLSHIARMAESVDATVSNTVGVTHPGSSPGPGTASACQAID